VFAFYFVLFGASATDVLANYLSVSLNVVLTSFRYLIFIVPAIVYPVAYQICKELQRVPNAGQRKRANIVLRSADGGYSTVPSEPRPGDAVVRMDPLPLDEDIELVPAMAGVLVMADGGIGAQAASLDGPSEETLQPGADEGGERRRGGIFKIPRDYR
jgi:ubiquinol-cytochrome c reductase cytochrome b subunit